MQVDEKEAGKTLLAYLRDHLEEYPSVKAIKRAIEAGGCTINGKVETFSTHRVQAKDEIVLTFPARAETRPLEVLYEDQALIFYNKPPKKNSESLSHYLLVHRLDKGTSGVILFAKTKKMQEELVDLFRKRKMEKTYLAIVDGKVAKQHWTVDNELERKASYQGGALYGRAKKGQGKRAITEFTLLNSKETASLVQAFPKTGRTHQIRVHLREMGHPVLGDYLYAKSFVCPEMPNRPMLHAKELAFVHPLTGQEIRIAAPLPEDFLSVQKKLFGA